MYEWFFSKRKKGWRLYLFHQFYFAPPPPLGTNSAPLSFPIVGNPPSLKILSPLHFFISRAGPDQCYEVVKLMWQTFLSYREIVKISLKTICNSLCIIVYSEMKVTFMLLMISNGIISITWTKRHLYLYKYENVCLSVCVCGFSRFSRSFRNRLGNPLAQSCLLLLARF